MNNNVDRAIMQLVAQRRRRIVWRAALTLGLGVACVAMAVWRMQRVGTAPRVMVLVGLALLGPLAVWQWWMLRRARHAAHAALATLDRELGLQARLITAAEFANAPEPPALYPMLVQETTQSLEAATKQSPSVVSRASLVLAVLLLLIGIWPWPGTPPVQLASYTPPAIPPPPIPLPPSPPPEPQPPQQQQQQSQQPQQGSQGQQGKQRTQGEQNKGSGNQGQQGRQGQQGERGQSNQNTQQSQSQSQGQGGQQQGKSGEQGTQKEQARQEQQQSASGKQGEQGSQGTQGQQESGQGHQGNQGQQGSQGVQAGQSAQVGAGAGAEALKADIQRALKELSGELKTLQAQLEAQQVSAPVPGTSTDPQLYGAASLEPPLGATSRLPLQLDVDTQATASARRGGGIGAPSGEIGAETPQQAPEEAQLAAQAAPESATHQHAIPPEYQPVFERLNRREPSSSEGSSP